MKRRDFIKTGAILPLVPYVGTKYNTPETDRVVYKLINNNWVEYPFDELKKDDIIRLANHKDDLNNIIFKVNRVYKSTDPNIPDGIAVNIQQV